jgi:hypothetical protein
MKEHQFVALRAHIYRFCAYQRVVSKMRVWSPKFFHGSHVLEGKLAPGWPQFSGLSTPLDTSPGTLPEGQDQTAMPESSHFMAYTPPPAALNPDPKDLVSHARIPHPGPPPSPDLQLRFMTEPATPSTAGSVEGIVQPNPVCKVAWLTVMSFTFSRMSISPDVRSRQRHVKIPKAWTYLQQAIFLVRLTRTQLQF